MGMFNDSTGVPGGTRPGFPAPTGRRPMNPFGAPSPMGGGQAGGSPPFGGVRQPWHGGSPQAPSKTRSLAEYLQSPSEGLGAPGMAPPPSMGAPSGMAPVPGMGAPGGMAPPPAMGAPGQPAGYVPPPPHYGPPGGVAPGMAPPPGMGAGSQGGGIYQMPIGAPGMAPPPGMGAPGMAPPPGMGVPGMAPGLGMPDTQASQQAAAPIAAPTMGPVGANPRQQIKDFAQQLRPSRPISW